MGHVSLPARRTIWLGVGLLVASLGTAVMAQSPRPTATPAVAKSLSINHDEAGCVVVGQFSQFKACFSPSSDLAKAEMYFRSEKTPAWYRVNFPAEGECRTATLPKPGKALLGTRLFLYASGTSRQWGETRTREYAAQVVASESECKGDKPVAPYVPSATVTVFPSLPVGFSAAVGGGGLPILAVVGGGAALAGGGAVLATSGGDDADGGGSSATPTTPPTATPTAAPVAATPTPTPTVGPNLPPTLVCRVTPNPPVGKFPFDVEFNLCLSEDPEGAPLDFNFDFGDGTRARGFCRQTHRYTLGGIFDAKLCVSDGPNERCCDQAVRSDSTYKLGWVDRLNVVSHLEVPGATGQVVMDGAHVAYPGEGIAHLFMRSRQGNIRFEAQIVSAGKGPGTWRFDLSQAELMVPGTLQAIGGKVLHVGSDVILFAVRGTPGERVSFTFQTWR